MGQVWQATDTQLNRQVALKILPDAFADDPDRLARFQREAQVLASLNHPNIAQIHGIEQDDDTRALVLELVEGPTLADCIARGPIPVDEALPIAKQIAEALEAAHEAGVIHRDLKPANIKVREDGTVKVLDFGLAKALQPEVTDPNMSLSPTMSLTAAATQMGMVIGTAAYMAPEQARGKPVGKQADVWAFGAVLYEMLTGRRPFAGADVSDTLAMVLMKEIDWSALPAETPASVRTLLTRCLARDQKQRIRDIGDAQLAMSGAFEPPVGAASDGTSGTPPSAGLGRSIPLHVAVPLAVGALVVGILGTWWVTGRSAPAPGTPVRLEARLGGPGMDERALQTVLSPDGTHLAYRVGASQRFGPLYVRALDEPEGVLLVPDGADAPFFSPDSQWVGFFTATELRKVPITGGTPQTLTSVNQGAGGSWGPDETITYGSYAGGLLRVSADGGEPEALTQLGEGQVSHRWPQLLAGGAVLYTAHTGARGIFDPGNIEALEVGTRQPTVVQAGSSFGRYLPTGHLVYVVEGTLFAVPFDVAALEVEGSAVPIVSDLNVNEYGESWISVSQSGTLAYLAGGGDDRREYPVVWVDREGNTTPLWGEPGEYGDPQLSPDGTRLALGVYRNGNMDVWMYDIERGVATQVTSHAARDDEATWSPDGQFLAFSSERDSPRSVYRIRADGSGDVERLTGGDYVSWPQSWSADGRFLAYGEDHPESSLDVWVLPLEGDREPQVFQNTADSEFAAQFSPNGRWIAYRNTTLGEIFVRPYPVAPGGGQVSIDGGRDPKWSADGRELFYRTESGVTVVPFEPDADEFTVGKAEELFTGAFVGPSVRVAGEGYPSYDVTADGQRFVMFPRTSDEDQAGNDHVTLVFNWFEELKALVPVN